jgi:beta-glucosidase-like glycosyl hydrolase
MCMHPNLASVLRGQLNFTGYVISDEGAITYAGPGYHEYTQTVQQAACLAMNAGTDMALGTVLSLLEPLGCS